MRFTSIKPIRTTLILTSRRGPYVVALEEMKVPVKKEEQFYGYKRWSIHRWCKRWEGMPIK